MSINIMRHMGAATVLACLLLAVPSHCLAQPDSPSEAPTLSTPEAQALFYAGLSAYRGKAYGEALVAFQRLLSVSSSADLHFNIAKSFEALGNESAARRWYEVYLSGQPQDESAVRQRLEALSQSGFELQDSKPVTALPASALTTERTQPAVSSQTLGWLAGGLGVLALGGSVVFGVQALGAESDAHSSRDADAVARYNLEASQSALRADMMLGGAIIGLGTAAYLWWIRDDSSKSVTPVSTSDGDAKRLITIHGYP